MRRAAAVAVVGIALAQPAGAQELPTAPLSAVERVSVSGPRPAERVSLAFAGGYGYTESVLGQSDSHHRLSGALAVEAALLRWLGVGLRLDGRYDRHELPGTPSDDGWTGDPRLYARADRPVGADASLGARLGLWLPGESAPSISMDAASVEAAALAAWTPAGGPVLLAANIGYRLDRSASAAPEPSSLGSGDRLALGVSDFDALLVGVGVSHGRPRWRLFAEWSWEKLVGAGAPAAGSPMRVGAGARVALGRIWAAEALVELGVGSRPDVNRPMAPLVPVPPRVAILAGLMARLGGAPAPPPAPAPPTPDPGTPARLEGRISFEGAAPPEVDVTVRSGGREAHATPDAEGRFVLPELPPGPAEVVATAPGYAPATGKLRLSPGGAATLELTLKRRLPVGQIRGTVRSFGGRGLAATIRISAVREPGTAAPPPREARAEDGAFQLDVEPGSYEVTIEAPGYDPQRRSVRVEENGVTVLNVDLRKR